MDRLDCTHDETIDGAGNLLSYTDASADFGDGALAVSCPCGSWIVEDATGAVIASSDRVATQHVTALIAA